MRAASGRRWDTPAMAEPNAPNDWGCASPCALAPAHFPLALAAAHFRRSCWFWSRPAQATGAPPVLAAQARRAAPAPGAGALRGRRAAAPRARGMPRARAQEPALARGAATPRVAVSVPVPDRRAGPTAARARPAGAEPTEA